MGDFESPQNFLLCSIKAEDVSFLCREKNFAFFFLDGVDDFSWINDPGVFLQGKEKSCRIGRDFRLEK